MANDTLADTQSQNSLEPLTFNLDSQPIEKLIYGRLFVKTTKWKSLGMRNRKAIELLNPISFYDLCEEIHTFGIDKSNDFVLSDKNINQNLLNQISKVHFKIEKNINNQFSPTFIYDLGQNGTYINGEKIGKNKKRILLDTDTIGMRLAKSCYSFYQYKDLGAILNNYPKDLTSLYYVSKQLGSGACGVVNLIYEAKSCKEFALKHVKKNTIESHITVQKKNEMNEVNILKSLEHPCVIKMYDIIENTQAVYMILEYMKGGDLLSRIIKNKYLTESIAKLYFYQMCHAVKYLHDKDITHRDIKPDNILLMTEDEVTLVKVSDFGLSKIVGTKSLMKTVCGTPLYVAPEVLLTNGCGSYTNKVDIWSLGVVLFTCLSGTLPFSAEYGSPPAKQIINGEFSFKSDKWKLVSVRAKNFIKELLTVNPDIRPNINEILNHSWLNDVNMIQNAELLMKINILQKENSEVN